MGVFRVRFSKACRTYTASANLATYRIRCSSPVWIRIPGARSYRSHGLPVEGVQSLLDAPKLKAGQSSRVPWSERRHATNPATAAPCRTPLNMQVCVYPVKPQRWPSNRIASENNLLLPNPVVHQLASDSVREDRR